VHTTVEE